MEEHTLALRGLTYNRCLYLIIITETTTVKFLRETSQTITCH
jgi:hypothetical protein